MKVVLDGSLLRGQYSGVETAVSGLARALARNAPTHEYHLLVPCDSEETAAPTGSLTIRRVQWVGRWRMTRIVWQHLLLPRVLAAISAEVFHAASYVMPLRCQVPSVLTLYDMIAFTHPELCKRETVLHYRLFVPPSLRQAGAIVVPTETVRREVVDRFPEVSNRLCVIPLAVSDEFVPTPDVGDAQVLKRLGVTEPYVLFVGNIEPKKNLDALLAAHATLGERRRSVHRLVVAGKPGWRCRKTLQRLQGQASTGATSYLGYTSRADLPALYRRASAFVLPSIVEGFGLPNLEAMACGTPVVTSNHPAVADTVGEAALVVDPHNTEELAQAILRVVSDNSLREELRERGLVRAAQYSWRTTALRTAAVYEELAA